MVPDKKKEAIAKQVEIAKESIKIIRRVSKYPPAKRVSTTLNRTIRIVQHLVIVRTCYVNIQIIVSQPNEPSEGLAVVAGGTINRGPEEIMPIDRIKELVKAKVIQLDHDKD